MCSLKRIPKSRKCGGSGHNLLKNQRNPLQSGDVNSVISYKSRNGAKRNDGMVGFYESGFL